MNKQTKILIGLAAVGVAGYYLWNKSKTKSFANVAGADNCERCKANCYQRRRYDNQQYNVGIGVYSSYILPSLCNNDCRAACSGGTGGLGGIAGGMVMASGKKNYVDTKSNQFFKPQMGHFY